MFDSPIVNAILAVYLAGASMRAYYCVRSVRKLHVAYDDVGIAPHRWIRHIVAYVLAPVSALMWPISMVHAQDHRIFRVATDEEISGIVQSTLREMSGE